MAQALLLLSAFALEFAAVEGNRLPSTANHSASLSESLTHLVDFSASVSQDVTPPIGVQHPPNAGSPLSTSSPSDTRFATSAAAAATTGGVTGSNSALSPGPPRASSTTWRVTTPAYQTPAPAFATPQPPSPPYQQPASPPSGQGGSGGAVGSGSSPSSSSSTSAGLPPGCNCTYSYTFEVANGYIAAMVIYPLCLIYTILMIAAHVAKPSWWPFPIFYLPGFLQPSEILADLFVFIMYIVALFGLRNPRQCGFPSDLCVTQDQRDAACKLPSVSILLYAACAFGYLVIVVAARVIAWLMQQAENAVAIATEHVPAVGVPVDDLNLDPSYAKELKVVEDKARQHGEMVLNAVQGGGGCLASIAKTMLTTFVPIAALPLIGPLALTPFDKPCINSSSADFIVYMPFIYVAMLVVLPLFGAISGCVSKDKDASPKTRAKIGFGLSVCGGFVMGLFVIGFTALTVSFGFAVLHFSFSACGPTFLRVLGRAALKCSPDLGVRQQGSAAERIGASPAVEVVGRDGDHIVSGVQSRAESKYAVETADMDKETELAAHALGLRDLGGGRTAAIIAVSAK